MRPARRAKDSSPVRQHWEKDGPASAPDEAEEPTRRSLLTPRSGTGKRPRLLPTAVRRGLLSFALRALRVVPFADCRYAGQLVKPFHPAPHESNIFTLSQTY